MRPNPYSPPESGASSYAIAQLADLVLTSWTSMGVECVRLGLPSLQAFRGVDIFPKEDVLNYTRDRATYMARLTQHQTVSPQQFLWAMRYTQMLLCGLAVDVGDLIPSFDDPTLPTYRTPACSPEIIGSIIEGRSLSKQRLRQRRRSVDRAFKGAELAAVCKSIARLIYVLAFWSDAHPSAVSFNGKVNQKLVAADENRLVVCETSDGLVDIRFRDEMTTVRSRSVKNLCHLYNFFSTHAGLS